MMRKSKERGFTLIEIIAVLVILGILAAVAVPKYVALQEEAKKKAAEGQVAEVKGTLNTAWGKAALSAGTTPSLGTVLSVGGLIVGSNTFGNAPDNWSVGIGTSGTAVNITVQSRGGDTGYSTVGTWVLPQ